MLINIEIAAQMIELIDTNSIFGPKLKKLLVKTDDGWKADSNKIEAYQEEQFSQQDLKYTMTSLAEYIIDLKGDEFFYKHLTTQEMYICRNYIKNGLLSCPYAKKIKAIFYEKFMPLYEEGYSKQIVPHDDRVPLDINFLKKHYWEEQKTAKQIACYLCVPVHWVEKEITRLGMQKNKNGIKRKGRKGYTPPPNWGKDRENQPHKKAVSRIDPITFKIVKIYPSIGAVRHDGFNLENVRKAIRRGGLSLGCLWALKGMETPTIDFAKRKGNLAQKLQTQSVQAPTKERMYDLYIMQRLHKDEIAKILKCSPQTVAQYAYKMGLKRKTPPISEKTLREEYLKNNLTAQEIANKYGKTKQTVSTYLSRLGITKDRRKDNHAHNRHIRSS